MPKKRNFVRAQARLQGYVPRKQDFRQGAAYRLAKNKRLENMFDVNTKVFVKGRFHPAFVQ